ncbi:hypothetical protein CSW98_14075 [Vibrio sp. HA2012]|uniref:major capsid protein P2 n=1 Tax=Vibrio sp. HA2012 TaxID=1971595 RepID=UPI000C2BA0CF|nr:major capsid protein P2 [Vibrio sp. HA2012]PJC85700.1 hypothetical protein CSW98_14075 [Vibrio sp. HA2012]
MELIQTPFAPRAKELDPIEGVGWGNRASLRLVSGPTYHDLELVTNITDPKDIERIEVSVNGKPIYSASGDTFMKIMKHRKTFTEAGRYVIPFGESELRTKIGVRQSDLVTLQGEIWFVHITLKAKDAGTPAPIMRARAHVLPAQSTRYYLPRLYELTWFASATGRTKFDFAERSPLINIKRLHFFDPSVERVRVERDNVEEYNVTKADNAYDLAVADQEQNADCFSLDFVRYGFGADGMLNTAASQQLTFELDKTAPGSVPLIVESVEQVTALPNAA